MEDFGVQRDRLREQNDFLLRLAVDQRRHVHDLDATLRGLTETAARCLGVQRVGIWELEPDSGRLRCRDRYDLADKTHGAGHLLTSEGFPTYFAALNASDCVAAEDVRMDRRFAEFVPAYANRRGTIARLDVVLRTDAGPRGVMMFEEFGPARLWTQDERAVASSLAEIAARTFALVDTERLRRQLDGLLADVGCTWLILDRDRHVAASGPGAAELFGVAPEELRGAGLADVLPGVEITFEGEDAAHDDEIPFGDLTTLTEDAASAFRYSLETEGVPVRLIAGDRVRTRAGRGRRRDVEVRFRELRHAGRDRALLLVNLTSELATA